MWTKWIYKDSFEIISKGLLRLFFVIFRHFSSGRSILWQKLFIPNRIKLKISKASFVIKIAFPIGKRIKQTTTWVQIFFKKWTLTISSYSCGGWIRIQNIGGERGFKTVAHLRSCCGTVGRWQSSCFQHQRTHVRIHPPAILLKTFFVLLYIKYKNIEEAGQGPFENYNPYQPRTFVVRFTKQE